MLSNQNTLTHWGKVMSICISKLTIIGWDNGLSPDWCQAIMSNNDGLSSIGTLGINFSEILAGLIDFHSRKCIWKCHQEFGSYFVPTQMCYDDPFENGQFNKEIKRWQQKYHAVINNFSGTLLTDINLCKYYKIVAGWHINKDVFML